MLWTWSTTYLAHANLPDRQVVVRFEFADRPHPDRTIWLVVRPTDAEVCTKPPGFPDDLVVHTTTKTLALWHTRQIGWAQALRSGKIRLTGPRDLARMLPTWNLRAATPWQHLDAPQSLARQQRGSLRTAATCSARHPFHANTACVKIARYCR